MKIREIISKLLESQDIYININDNIFAFPHQEGVVIAFNSKDAISIIDNSKDYSVCNVNLNNCIFEDEMAKNFSYRLAGTIKLNNLSLNDVIETGIIPSLDNLESLSNNKPILLKIAQWGGVGGQGVDNIGQGIGAGNLMSGAVNFDNPIVRIQFDKSLDMVRKEDSNDWSKSLESRMQENQLYGHKRNNKDWNLNNYRMTAKERRLEKKKEYVRRMIENRKRFDKIIDQNSVENIKASPVDPKYYIPIEEKLKEKRHQKDDTEKRTGQHGPESQFKYFPPQPKKVLAQTVVRNGLSSIFENDPESMKNERAYPDEFSGRLRIREFPWAMYGPTREKYPIDFREDNNLMWGGSYNNSPENGQGGKFGIDFLADGYATGKNPGEIQQPIFTKDMLPGIINEIKDHLKVQDDFQKQKVDDNLPIEKKLKTQHKAPATTGITPTTYDIQRMDDEYPYATKNFFVPRVRLDHSNG